MTVSIKHSPRKARSPEAPAFGDRTDERLLPYWWIPVAEDEVAALLLRTGASGTGCARASRRFHHDDVAEAAQDRARIRGSGDEASALGCTAHTFIPSAESQFLLIAQEPSKLTALERYHILNIKEVWFTLGASLAPAGFAS